MSERLTFNCGTTRHAGNAPAPAAAAPPPETAPSAMPAFQPPRREPLDWAFLGLMAFTALLFFRPQDVFPPLAHLRLAEVAALFALVSMVMGRLGRGQSFTRMPVELIAVFGIATLILLLAPFSIWPGGVVATFTELYLKVVLIFVLMVNTLTTPTRVNRFAWLIVVATSYIAFRTAFDYARGLNLIENGRVQGAVGGIFKNPNDLALNMVAIIPLAASFAIYPASAARRIAATCAVGLMLAAVVASQSRSGFIGLIGMLVVFAAVLARRRPGIVFAAALSALIVLPMLPSSYWERVSSIVIAQRDVTGSRQARATLLREAVEAFAERPLTGVGAGQFKNYKPEQRTESWRETHNVLLQVGAELGVVGLVLFMFLVVRAFSAPLQAQRLLRLMDKRHPKALSPTDRRLLDMHSAIMVAALAGWFVCALFASVAYHWTFYYLLALAMAPRDILRVRFGADAAVPSPAAPSLIAGVRA